MLNLRQRNDKSYLPSQMYFRLSSMLARQREPRKNLPYGLCKLQLTVQTPLQSLQQSAFTHTASNSDFSAKVTTLPSITTGRSSKQIFLGDCAATGCVSMLCIAHCWCAVKKLPCCCRGRGAKNLRYSIWRKGTLEALSGPVTRPQSSCASVTSRLKAIQTSKVNASSQLCCCPELKC